MRLQTISLLEEEKDGLKMQHAKEISIFEKRLHDSELEKAKAQEKAKALSEQDSSQAMKQLVEESKKSGRLEAALEQLEEEKNELLKQNRGMLVCKQFVAIAMKMPVFIIESKMLQHIFLHKQ